MQHLWEAIIHWQEDMDQVFVVQKPLDKIDCRLVAAMDPANAEKWLTSLGPEALARYCDEAIKHYGPLAKVKLKVDPDALPFQTTRKITIQQPLQLAADAKVNSLIEEGVLSEVDYNRNLWIHDYLLLRTANWLSS